MARVKRGVTKHARHKKVLKLAEGYVGRSSTAYRPALERVEKTFYAAQGDVHALGPVSFTIEAGETLAIVGPSGCGKSTLLRIVAGLDEATAGRVTVDGKPVTGPLPGVGIVFQRDLLLDWRSVLANVMLPTEFRRSAGSGRGSLTSACQHHLHRPSPRDGADHQAENVTASIQAPQTMQNAALPSHHSRASDPTLGAAPHQHRDGASNPRGVQRKGTDR